jgi:hypothetical protein
VRTVQSMTVAIVGDVCVDIDLDVLNERYCLSSARSVSAVRPGTLSFARDTDVTAGVDSFGMCRSRDDESQ